ncbi:MAG TPA: TlpA disulfide reductase family protein [Nocardioides sp.]|nr:TlpA disulfide reductase family protein [Nocardioides sp.]
MRKVLVAALLTASLSACASDGGIDVRPPDIEVDTPALREVKARIGMQDCAPGDGDAVDGGLPAVTLPCLGGGPDVDLSTLRGPMVINLWAANCGPCEKEMPALEAFHQQYGDRVAVLGVDFNDVHPARALQLAEDTGVTYPSVADPGGELMVEDTFAVVRRGLPGFVFVDETGAVVGQSSGGVDSVAEIEELVAEQLGIDL